MARMTVWLTFALTTFAASCSGSTNEATPQGNEGGVVDGSDTNPETSAEAGADAADAGDAKDQAVEQDALETSPDVPTNPDVCSPSCDEKQCGSNGCGGVCGECMGCEGPAPELCRADGICMQTCCPISCQQAGVVCGVMSDGCGAVVDCGVCQGCDGPEPSLCSLGKCASPCCPTSCVALKYTCGMVSDGCGGVLDCGTCEAGACTDNQCP